MIAVDCVHRKCGKADRDVFGSAFMGSGIANPLAGVGDYGLSCGDFERASFVFYVERALKDDGELIKGGSLAGLKPSGRAAHVGHAR